MIHVKVYLAVGALIVMTNHAHSFADADPYVVMKNDVARLALAVGGGAIVEFRFADHDVNPLNFEATNDIEPRQEGQPFLRGHFVCLDRWGAPSETEAKNGVPFHGEAPRIIWQVSEPPKQRDDGVAARMGCRLPLAGLRVERSLRLHRSSGKGSSGKGASALVEVTEEVTNENKLGRVYNLVQHPSIAPPFLDERTRVDSNAKRGFVQLPESALATMPWPRVQMDGESVDLRMFENPTAPATRHDVSSFVFDDDETYGWVTATNSGKGLLLGYLWKTEDYPWLNIWRYRFEGRVAARGLEFGTTGYHQPFSALVDRGKLLDRRLFEYLDAEEAVARSYAMFLFRVPDDFAGVASVSYNGEQLTLAEDRESNPRRLETMAEELFGGTSGR